MRYMVFLFAFILSCHQINPTNMGSFPMSHEIFDELLKKHVDSEGLVDYQGFLLDSQKLSSYISLLATNAPNDKSWSPEDQIAYWINVYNSFTIDLILRNYPLSSIKEIGSSIQIPFLNTPWDIKLIKIGNESYDLNNIEHDILRKKWDEPRIHFAINCASFSCPKLRNEAYSGETLEKQLEEQAIEFINDKSKNEIDSNSVYLSKIFRWFSRDFEKQKDLKSFINKYSRYKIPEESKIEFKDYDWSLNDSNPKQ